MIMRSHRCMLSSWQRDQFSKPDRNWSPSTQLICLIYFVTFCELSAMKMMVSRQQSNGEICYCSQRNIITCKPRPLEKKAHHFRVRICFFFYQTFSWQQLRVQAWQPLFCTSSCSCRGHILSHNHFGSGRILYASKAQPAVDSSSFIHPEWFRSIRWCCRRRWARAITWT